MKCSHYRITSSRRSSVDVKGAKDRGAILLGSPGAESWPASTIPRERQSTREPRRRIGLALSSGGARGLAHVGVIQVLEENGISIDAIAGASMGAYVGALWAAGYTGAELANFASEITSRRELWRRLDLALPPVRGLFYGDGLRRRLAVALQDATFNDLERELHVVATDLDTLQRLVFTSGDVAHAVHASAAVPGLCVPVELGGRQCSDGGIVDPVPVEVLRDAGCTHVIAVNVLPTTRQVRRGTTRSAPLPRRWLSRVNRSINVFAPGNVVDLLRRAIFAGQIRLAERAAAGADVIIHPVAIGSRWHDYHLHAAYIAAGRRAAEEALPQLLALGGRDPSSAPVSPSRSLNSTSSNDDENHPALHYVG